MTTALRLAGPEPVGDYRVFLDLAPVFAPSAQEKGSGAGG
jgi:hypothetical protein